MSCFSLLPATLVCIVLAARSCCSGGTTNIVIDEESVTGWRLLEKGDVAQALAVMSSHAATRGPTAVESVIGLTVCFLRKNDPSSASLVAEGLRKAIPASVTYDRLQAAKTYLDQAITEHPDFAPLIIIRAQLYQETLQYAKSVPDWQAVMDSPITPPDMRSVARKHLAISLNEIGSTERVEKLLAKWIADDPMSFDAHYMMGLSHQNRHHNDQAEHFLKIANDLVPQDELAFCALTRSRPPLKWGTKWPSVMKRLRKLVGLEITNTTKPRDQPRLQRCLLAGEAIVRPIPPDQRLALARKESLAFFNYVSQFPQITHIMQKGLVETPSVGFVFREPGDPVPRIIHQAFSGKGTWPGWSVVWFLWRDTGVSTTEDAVKHIHANVDEVVEIKKGVSAREAALKINRRGIHILCDLKGMHYMDMTELLAYRPVPIQITLLGFLASSGSQLVDLLISDRIATPPELQSFYSEHLVLFPPPFFPSSHNAAHSGDVVKTDEVCQGRHKSAVMWIPTRFTDGIRANASGVVFANMHQPRQIDPTSFQIWAKIVSRVNNSTLWTTASTPNEYQAIRTAGIKSGLSDQQMLISHVIQLRSHMQRLSYADLSLDCVDKNGGTTALDSWFAGVPLITTPGETLMSRVASSIAVGVGAGDLVIARTRKELERVAVRLARSPDLLRAAKCKAAKARDDSRLFDIDRWRGELLSALRLIWNAHRVQGEDGGKVYHVIVSEAERTVEEQSSRG